MGFVKTAYGGIALNYDKQSQPFFEAIVTENLRLLNAIPHGAAILKAIEKATPSYTGGSSFPPGIKLIIQPPLERNWRTPGLSSKGVTDQVKYDNFQKGIGKMIPTMPSKTQAQEVDKASAQGGGGSVCWLFYSNTEIITEAGEWLPPHITLGHELIHCVHALYGETKKNPKEEEWATVGIKGFTGTYTENKLRADAKIKEREKYFKDD